MASSNLEPFAGKLSQRFEVSGRYVQRFTVPAYGFIERFEVFPDAGLLANMDAMAPHRVEIALFGPDGAEIPCSITAVCRDVATPEEDDGR